jgi:23S rRNA (guanosine2251-2'-O)-methyltransferase
LTDWIGGRRPVAEALVSGRQAHRLLISNSARPSSELKEVLARAREASVPVETVPGDRIVALAGFDGHQGVLLEVGERRWADPAEMLANAQRAGHEPLIVLLEHLQDPVNFGTLLRSAEAAGVDGAIFPERGAAPLSAAAVKASAGASEHVLLARVESLGQVMRDLQARGLRVVAADQDAPTSAWETDLGGPLAVVVGAEGEGISGATRRRVDLLVSFPMSGRVASLNAATAGALLLFEVVRQRTAAGRGGNGR